MGRTWKIIHPIPCELLALVHKSRMMGSSLNQWDYPRVGPEGEINHQIIPIKSPFKSQSPFP